MRVAALALVLIVGAAVVLAFANTLNSWVLGGLLGGLAAILISIPISLVLFTLIARRQDARQREEKAGVHFVEDPYYEEESVVYEADGFSLSEEDMEPQLDETSQYAHRRLRSSGYLSLPPAGYSTRSRDREQYQEPRNYPRQPRPAARDRVEPAPMQRPAQKRNLSTRSLAQHRSEALRQARLEASSNQHQENGSGSSSLSRHAQTNRGQTQRPSTRSTQQPRPSSSFTTGAVRPSGRRDGRSDPRRETPRSWDEQEFSDDLSTDQLDEPYQPYPRHPTYPRRQRASRMVDPSTDALDEDKERDAAPQYRPGRDPERVSGSLRNPLVRRAPYLYEDDPLREAFAQQLDPDRHITRRSSLYDDEE